MESIWIQNTHFISKFLKQIWRKKTKNATSGRTLLNKWNIRGSAIQLQNVKKLRKFYDSVEQEKFTKEFISNLRGPLIYLEKHPLYFKFAIKVFNHKLKMTKKSMNKITTCRTCVWVFIIQSWCKSYWCKVSRVCNFLNMMRDNASIAHELCSKIWMCMMDRILDKSPKIRA